MDEWILTRLEEIKKRFAEIENLMTKQEVVSNQNEMKKLSKEYRNLEKINKLWDEYTKTSNELEDTKEMINSDDQEISELAKLENETLSKNLDKIPKDTEQRKTITIDGKQLEIITGESLVRHQTETVVSLTAISGESGILAFANHDGYPVKVGDEVLSTWTIIRPIH